MSGEIASQTAIGTTVRHRIEVAGQYLVVDEPHPAGRPILTGTLALSFDPSRLRVWPANSTAPELRWPGL